MSLDGLSRAALSAWAAQAITILFAGLLCRKRLQHRPFAAWAAVVFLVDVGRIAIERACPWIWHGPHEGTHRAIFHADQGLFLLEPIGLVAVAWIAFLSRRPWGPLLAGLAMWAALCVGYPEPFRADVLGYAYAAVYAGSILASLVAIIIWTRRRAHPRTEHACVLLSVLMLGVLFAGPFAPPAPRPFDGWSSAEVLYVCLWAALAVIHAAALWWGFGMQPSGRDRSARLH